jgi:tetratricopeptide (TPR) repeat protein
MNDVDRPVLRGLRLDVDSLTAELAELVLERVRSDTAAVISRSAPLSERATLNRDATLAAHCPPAVTIDAGNGKPSPFSGELVALGCLYHRAGELDRAERCYIDALEANEQCETAHRSYGLLLEELGELEDARVAYLWATRARGTPAGWLGVARIESALDRPQPAGASLGHALRVARPLSELLEVAITATAFRTAEAGITAFAMAAQRSPEDPGLPYAAARLAQSCGAQTAMRLHAGEALARDATSRRHSLGDRAASIARLAV